MQTSPIFVFPVVLLLAACGGSEVTHRSDPFQSIPQQVEETTVAEAYSGAVYQNPGWAEHQSVSYIHAWRKTNTINIGGDVEPREKLRHIDSIGEIDYFVGASRDGVGVDRLENYADDINSENQELLPFEIAPQIHLNADWSTDLGRMVLNSVWILNDALPPEFQIRINHGEAPRFKQEGDIFVDIIPPEDISNHCGPSDIACATGTAHKYANGDEYTNNSRIFLPSDLHTNGCAVNSCIHTALGTIVHELIHALGVWEHVDHIEFPDSLMGTQGDAFPNFGFTIHRIDREILQVNVYVSINRDL